MIKAEIGPGEFYPVVGVGPHPEPWPTDLKYDPELLAQGDRRNVIDKFRYWKVSAIVEELDKSRAQLQIAIENWQHDLNIGSVVRTANAFNISLVHIVGKRDWNRRGAMVTDKYLHVMHHATIADFANWAAENKVPIIGIDNLPHSERIEGKKLPEKCILFFGQEGTGLSDEAGSITESTYEITQYGSTRSMNASAAAAIAIYHWRLQHLPIS
jgi:tRNA G18 (ribose-2'-O)-methylase SpoU